MQPSMTLIRVRTDGVPADADGPLRRRYAAEWGDLDWQELPCPPYHSARDFALDLLDAVARARGEWILVLPDGAEAEAGALAALRRRLGDPAAADLQGLLLSGRPRRAGAAVFASGFTLDALEIGKAAHPWLVDPARLLSFFALRASLARSIAEDLVRVVDPVPAVLSFAAAARLADPVLQGLIREAGDVGVLHDPAPDPEGVARGAMEAFEAERSEEALRGLDYFRFAWGSNPSIDLHRAVLGAKLERFWLANFAVRRFLQRNKGNAHAIKLAEALATRKGQYRAGYPAASQLLDRVEAGRAEGEDLLFSRMDSLHEQAVALVIGDAPVRAGLALGLACLGTPRKVIALSPFRAPDGAGRRLGRCLDVWKSAVSSFDLEDNVEATASIRERLAAWGDAPRPDILLVSLRGDADMREEISAAFALLNEGGLLVVEGADASRPAAWRFWTESAEPALSDRGRQGSFSFGTKGSAPLGGKRLPMTFPELWRRCRLPEPYERTMLTSERFRNAFTVSRIADMRKLPGAIVECGVWKGGCSASMLLAAQQTGSRRALWAFDSFQGLPRPTEKDGSFAMQKSDEWGGAGCEATELEFRETLFGIAGLKDENVHIRKGWFQDTLPKHKHEIGPIAILRLDGDWYDSVMICLEHLYEYVVPGGYILIDDYGFFEGARKATDEWRERLGIRSPLITTDHDERYWVKIDEKSSWTPGGQAVDRAIGNANRSGSL